MAHGRKGEVVDGAEVGQGRIHRPLEVLRKRRDTDRAGMVVKRM